MYEQMPLGADSDSEDDGGLLVAHEGDEDDKPAGNPNPKVPHRWRVTIMMALAFVLCNMDKACRFRPLCSPIWIMNSATLGKGRI